MGPAWYGVSRPRLRVACHHERTWGAMSMPRVVLCDVRVGHADADLRAQTRSSVSKKDGWTGEGGGGNLVLEKLALARFSVLDRP